MSKSSSIINLSYLKDASANNHTFIKEMIEIFLKQTPVYLSQLRECIGENKKDDFRKIIHKLKPTVTMMGIEQGDLLIKEIEATVKNTGNLDRIESAYGNLEAICEASYSELKEELRLIE